jgi:DNA repair and recombination protein RAD52
MFTDEQKKALSAPLDPSKIKPPPKGKFGSYVDGFHIVTEANRIFGHDGWSYAITALVQCARVETVDSRQQPQVRVGYRCTVRVEAGGVWREGAAVGTGMAKPENEADAHESAVKEAETDALKRALRSFGHTFGLALYDKSDNNANIGTAPITDAQYTELVTHMEALGVPPAALIQVANDNLGTSISQVKDLPATAFADALAWVKTQRKAA